MYACRTIICIITSLKRIFIFSFFSFVSVTFPLFILLTEEGFVTLAQIGLPKWREGALKKKQKKVSIFFTFLFLILQVWRLCWNLNMHTGFRHREIYYTSIAHAWEFLTFLPLFPFFFPSSQGIKAEKFRAIFEKIRVFFLCVYKNGKFILTTSLVLTHYTCPLLF